MLEPMQYNLEELKDKAKQGDGLSSYLLGRSYFSEENGAKCDYEESVKWYKYGVESLEDAKCMYGLGICYDDGVGSLEKDIKKADELFTKALHPLMKQAKNNDPYAMFILGAYYFYGFAGIEKDNEKAFKAIYGAAMHGHLAGIYDIGTFYHNGVGVEKNYSKSKKFLEIASNSGLERATSKLTEWSKDFDSDIEEYSID